MIATKTGALFALLAIQVAFLSACHGDTQTTQNKGENSVVDSGSSSTTTTDGCTRKLLNTSITKYFEALEAHDPSQLPLASKVKYTENGDVVSIGQGLWKTAGALKFKRSALDVETCNSITESAIAEGDVDIVVGVRLRLEDEKITEIEAIVVRDQNDYFIHSAADLIATASDDWETVLPESERATREDLFAIVETYYATRPHGACDFAEDCQRYEDGAPLGPCVNPTICGDAGTEVVSESIVSRLYVLDVEAGIAAGVTFFPSVLFGGFYAGFHMFKYRDGKVHGLHALFAKAEQSGWD